MNRRQFSCIALALACFATTSVEAENVVRVGFQRIYNPWKVAIARGEFKKATGWEIEWVRLDSGGKVIQAMAAGDLDIALAGSSPIAAGVNNGVDLRLFWIAEDIASAEAFVVRDGSGIDPSEPATLKGKKIGVPFVSTTHFHTLFALEVWGIEPNEVEIIDMQPNDMATAWEQGEIDAGFVWDPALGRLKQSGQVMVTSGQLSKLGKATFDGMVAMRSFAEANAEGMRSFVKVLADADTAYRDNPEKFSPESPEVQMIVGLVGGNPSDVPEVLSLYTFPTLEEQASERWLGGGAVEAIYHTSTFLETQGELSGILDDYSTFVSAEYVEAVLRR